MQSLASTYTFQLAVLSRVRAKPSWRSISRDALVTVISLGAISIVSSDPHSSNVPCIIAHAMPTSICIRCRVGTLEV